MQVERRVPRLREALRDAGCDALLVTNLVSIRYLTGFTGSAAMLLLLPEELLFVTDGRYGDQSPSAQDLGRAFNARIVGGKPFGAIGAHPGALARARAQAKRGDHA